MNRTISRYYLALIASVFVLTGCTLQKVTKYNLPVHFNIDTVQAGMFDSGRMWTFDFPPTGYFRKIYNFTPTKEWFDKARLSALRLPNCTAFFVSEDGLVMTNHHCSRSALENVNKEGERLSQDGFYAATLDEERRAVNIYIDQLVVIEDVTAEVQQAFESGTTDAEKTSNQLLKCHEIQQQYAEKYKSIAPQDSMIFNIVTFYNGGRYSLYGYKRYTDVRLVYAPEEAIAFFGGDPDNFTYPRYDFDCAFFRVYDNGTPLKTKDFFLLSPNGPKEGEAVFVIGNPGKTNRLKTFAQLEFLRDFEYPARIERYEKTGNIYSSYIQAHPETKLEHSFTIFRLENSRKAVTGYLDGLCNPVLMAKKKDFENNFKKAVFMKPGLKEEYGDPWSDIAKHQTELAEIYNELNALKYSGRYGSQYLSLTKDLVEIAYRFTDSIPKSTLENFYPSKLEPEIEKKLLAFRLEVMKRAFRNESNAFNSLLNGRTPEQAAADLAEHSIISSKERTDIILAKSRDDILQSSDPLIAFIVATRERTKELQNKYNEISNKLQTREQALGMAMYEIYGTHIPPDATFTLRITDGIVKGYDYNGTIAPPVTTFYGLYDRYYSFGMKYPWILPDRWIDPPSTFRMNTPMNFVSTNDIIGGNSGSPAINKDLQVVGLIFDGNIESLPGNIIFDDTKNRSVSVHSAGILEVLKKIYGADRLVKELQVGKITP